MTEADFPSAEVMMRLAEVFGFVVFLIVSYRVDRSVRHLTGKIDKWGDSLSRFADAVVAQFSDVEGRMQVVERLLGVRPTE